MHEFSHSWLTTCFQYFLTIFHVESFTTTCKNNLAGDQQAQDLEEDFSWRDGLDEDQSRSEAARILTELGGSPPQHSTFCLIDRRALY